MTNPDPHAALREHLAELRLDQIAELYPEVLNEAARKNCSPLDVTACDSKNKSDSLSGITAWRPNTR